MTTGGPRFRRLRTTPRNNAFVNTTNSARRYSRVPVSYFRPDVNEPPPVKREYIALLLDVSLIRVCVYVPRRIYEGPCKGFSSFRRRIFLRFHVSQFIDWLLTGTAKRNNDRSSINASKYSLGSAVLLLFRNRYIKTARSR